MKAFKYTMVDLRRGKAQIISFLLLSCIAYLFARDNSILAGMAYLIFMASMLYASNFTQEQKSEAGFAGLLPGTEKERVVGRFFTGVLYLVFAMGIGVLFWVQLRMAKMTDVTYMWETFLIFLGMGFVAVSVQSIMFYLIKKDKTQQFMVIIQMLPSFLLYLAITIVIEACENKGEELESIINYVMNNLTIISIGALLLGVVIMIICVNISEKIVDVKDFS